MSSPLSPQGMTIKAALRYLRRAGRISSLERSLFLSQIRDCRTSSQPLPQSLWPVAQQIYLLSTQPPTLSRH